MLLLNVIMYVKCYYVLKLISKSKF